MPTIWILGATGKGGRAIASELIGNDADLVLIGRDRDRLATVAAALGGQNRTILSPGPAQLVARIAAEKPTVVVNTIGPFGETSAPLARACLAAGSHYVDLANELPPVQALLNMDADARSAGVTVVTGAGFGVLATEALVIELAQRPSRGSPRDGRRDARRGRLGIGRAVQRDRCRRIWWAALPGRAPGPDTAWG